MEKTFITVQDVRDVLDSANINVKEYSDEELLKAHLQDDLGMDSLDTYETSIGLAKKSGLFNAGCIVDSLGEKRQPSVSDLIDLTNLIIEKYYS